MAIIALLVFTPEKKESSGPKDYSFVCVDNFSLQDAQKIDRFL